MPISRLILGSSLTSLCLYTGCAKPPDTAPATPATATPAIPATVSTVAPKQQTLNWTVDQPATAVAFESAPLVAKLPGYVAKVHADIGDKVKTGQLLAELSIPELLQEANQKAALVLQAKAEREQARQSIEVAKARLDVAKAGITEAEAGTARADADFARWQGELKRVDGLVGQKVIDSQTRDETQKQFLTATAMRTEMIAKVTSAKASVIEAAAMLGRARADEDAMAAKLAVAEAEVKRVEALVSYTKIVAPFDGIVTQRNVHPGHFLQPAAGVKLEQLFIVMKTDVIRVSFDVPENAASQVVIGSKAVVKVPGLKGREIAGAITRTSGVLTSDSRTLRAEIDLPNADGAIKPGSYCTVRITAGTPDAMVLPTSAIQYADETTYAYEVVDGKILKQRVRIGRIDAGMVEVAGKKRLIGIGDWQPLTTADRFASSNLGSLTDGQPVAVGQ